MSERFLLDTNILIDQSRRSPAAMEYMSTLRNRPVLSVVTVAELYAGVREGTERVILETLLSRAIVIDIDAQIAEQAGLFVRDFRKSHGCNIADAMIAATAVVEGATLVTQNVRHFPMLPQARLLKPY